LCFIILIPLLFVNSITFLHQHTPIVNDALVNTAEFIKDSTKENAIIVTEWDQGYFYQYFAKRATIIDPGHPINNRVTLLAKIFMEEDEEQARNLIQTIACGGDLGLVETEKIITDPSPIAPCNNPPEIMVVVNEKIVGKARVMKELALQKNDLKISKISKCSKKEETFICENGYVISGHKPVKNKIVNI